MHQTFEIAGLRLRLETQSRPLMDKIRERFVTYEAPQDDRPPDAVIDFEDMGPGWRTERAYVGPYPQADMAFAGTQYRFWRREFDGEILLSPLMRGDFRVSADNESFETPVRLATSLLASRTGGLLLHAGGVLLDGQAFIFTALSTGGKTTLTEILRQRGAPVLSDEVVAVAKRRGCWRAFSTPFTGGPSPANKRSGVLLGIAFLHKSTQNHLVAADRRSGFRRILRNTLAYIAEPASADELLGTAIALCSEVPLLELEFVKDPSVDSYLRLHLFECKLLESPKLVSRSEAC